MDVNLYDPKIELRVGLSLSIDQLAKHTVSFRDEANGDEIRGVWVPQFSLDGSVRVHQASAPLQGRQRLRIIRFNPEAHAPYSTLELHHVYDTDPSGGVCDIRYDRHQVSDVPYAALHPALDEIQWAMDQLDSQLDQWNRTGDFSALAEHWMRREPSLQLVYERAGANQPGARAIVLGDWYANRVISKGGCTFSRSAAERITNEADIELA